MTQVRDVDPPVRSACAEFRDTLRSSRSAGAGRGAGPETPRVQPTRHVHDGDAASGGLLHRRAGDRLGDPRPELTPDDDDVLSALWIRPSSTSQGHLLPGMRRGRGTHQPGPPARPGSSELSRLRASARESSVERDLLGMRARHRRDATVPASPTTRLVLPRPNPSVSLGRRLAARRDLPDDHHRGLRLRPLAVKEPASEEDAQSPRTASSTASACPGTFTLSQRCATLPSGPMR